MEKPEHHIFVCMSFRGLEPKGKCIKKNAPELLGYLESELADRGLDSVMVSTTGCLKLCDHAAPRDRPTRARRARAAHRGRAPDAR